MSLVCYLLVAYKPCLWPRTRSVSSSAPTGVCVNMGVGGLGGRLS